MDTSVLSITATKTAERTLKVILVLPLPLGCGRVDVPLEGKLELILLKMPFGELAGDLGAPFPGSMASTGLWFPNCPKQGEPRVLTAHPAHLSNPHLCRSHSHLRFGTRSPFSAQDASEMRGSLRAPGFSRIRTLWAGSY